MTSVDIQPIESGGKYWIHVTMDGDASLTPRGPFPDADAAQAAANKIAGVCRVFDWPVTFRHAGAAAASAAATGLVVVGDPSQ